MTIKNWLKRAKEGLIKDEGRPTASLAFHAVLGRKLNQSAHRRGTHRSKRILNPDVVEYLP